MNTSITPSANDIAVSMGDVRQQVANLTSLTTPELRIIWRRHHQTRAPTGLSRDLLIRFIAYKIQERTFGCLSKSMLRRLDTLARNFSTSGTGETDLASSVKPGTRLVREWGGTTHTVLVLNDGFEYAGDRYASLTRIAAEISGLHRSGPAFFGLTRKSTRFVEQRRSSQLGTKPNE